MQPIKSNYLAYIVVYFTINIMSIYLLLYFPLYFFDVLNVDRSALALVQLVSNSMLILAIFLGYFFDKYSQKKKIFISFSGIIMFTSFLLFILFRNILFWFGFFLSVSLIMMTIIKTGMSKLMFEIVKSNNVLKKNVILISNVSSSFGAFIPTILFSLVVYDFYSFSLWNTFFLIGWIVSFPLLFTYLLIKENNSKLIETQSEVSLEKKDKRENSKAYSNNLLMILICISYFLFWSSYLFGYPLSSWIMSNFGEDAFRFYSSFYVIFFLFNMSGFYIAKRIYKKGNEARIIILGILSVVCLFLVYPYVNFPVFFFLYSIDALIYGMVVSNFLYIIIDISRRGKYENLKYQIMQSSSYLGNAIFTPIGIYLSCFFSTGFLMAISAFLVLSSIIPLIIKEIPRYSIN